MAIDPNSSSSSSAAATPATTPSAAATLNSARPFPITNPIPSRPISPQLLHPHAHHPHHQQPPPLYTAQPLPVRMSIPPYNPTSQLPRPPHAHTHESPSYPVASSGRGYISKALRPLPAPSSAAADQTVTVANPGGGSGGGGYPPRSPTNFHLANHAAHAVRPLQHHHQHYHPHHVAAAKGVPIPVQPKVASSSSVPECNGYKDIREKSRDDTLAVVRDRKVRITEGASLYALCRSWLRNGLPEESQPQFGDAVRSLPKPLPIAVATGNLQKEEGEVEEDTDDGVEEDEESVELLSAEALFKGHVKRAKKVRARLREVRLKQIARYKSRLALLLPPLVEQFRNDVAAAGT